MKKFFITATGTEIGKTYFMCQLIHKLRAKQQQVKALKPVITGLDFNADYSASDSALILQALDIEPSKTNIQKISPFHFEPALSPDSAALIEQKPYLDFAKLSRYCTDFLAATDADYALIEGAGGIMVPLDEQHLILDLLKILDIPILLIADNYLGMRSHSLTALETLKAHGLENITLLVNNICGDETSFEQNLNSLQKFTNVPCYSFADFLAKI